MIEGQSGRLRPLEWIGGSKKDLMALPDEVVNVFGYALYLALGWRETRPGKGAARFRVRRRAGGRRRLARQHLPRGVHGSFCSAGVRAACVSEEIQVRYRNAEAGPGFDQGKIESGDQARQGAGR